MKGINYKAEYICIKDKMFIYYYFVSKFGRSSSDWGRDKDKIKMPCVFWGKGLSSVIAGIFLLTTSPVPRDGMVFTYSLSCRLLVSCCRMTCSGMRTRAQVGKIQIWEHGWTRPRKITPHGAVPLDGTEARKT